MTNFDKFSQNMNNIPENCELRDDFMSCTLNNSPPYACFFSILLCFGTIICGILLYGELAIQNISAVLWEIFVFVLVLVIPSFCLMLYTLTFQKYFQLDKNGFYQEYRSVFGRYCVKKFSLCSIRKFHINEYHSNNFIDIILCIHRPTLLFLKHEHLIYCYYGEIITTGKKYRLCTITGLNDGLLWFIITGNHLLQKLFCIESILDTDRTSINSFNQEDEWKFAIGDLPPLPTKVCYTISSITPIEEKPGYCTWNVKNNLKEIRFFRYNQYSKGWFEAIPFWIIGFVILLLLIYKDISWLKRETIGDIMWYCEFYIIKSIFYSFLLIPVGFLISFLVTPFTTVSWTFTTNSANLKRTIFGIPFFFWTFNYSKLKFVEIRQRFFLGITDGNCDVIFKDSNKKEVFRIKNVNRCDTNWMINQIIPYFS